MLGGVDPVRELQNGSPGELMDVLAKCHQQAGFRYIVGAGCEVPPATPLVNLRIMADYAKNSK